MCGRSLSRSSRNIQFLTGQQRLAGTRLMAFQISFLQISKALKLKTVLSMKTQVWTQPGPEALWCFIFLHSRAEPRVTSSLITYLLYKWRKTCSFDSWGVTLIGSLGTQYQWRSLFPLPWMQQREKKRRLALFMIFLFNFCWKWNCVLLILQTNGGEVEAQKFLLGSPERGAVFVVWCGKSPVYLLHCHVVPEWFAVGSVGWIQHLHKRKWWSHSLWIKDLNLPFISKTCFPWPPPPCPAPSLSDDERNTRTLSELDPSRKSSQKSLLFRMHLGREGERRRVLRRTFQRSQRQCEVFPKASGIIPGESF